MRTDDALDDGGHAHAHAEPAYAPTWVTLMLMPQYMDMNMSQRLADPGEGSRPFARNALKSTAPPMSTSAASSANASYASFKVLDQLKSAATSASPAHGDRRQASDTHQLTRVSRHHMQLGSAPGTSTRASPTPG
jgi:hypothetical protein